jgi:flagellar assembly protein FliH
LKDDGSLQIKYDQGFQEGYDAGHAQGRLEAEAEAHREMQAYRETQGRETAERLAALVTALEARLAEAEQRIADSVLELACALARQVVRQELAGNPNALQPVVREALGILMADGRSAVVRLNPADMDVVEQPLREEFSTLALTWMADAAVPPGGCLVESAGAVVDGSLEKRWQRAVANLGLNGPWEPEPQEDEH